MTIKRAFDVVFSACALLVTSPLILVGAVAVKLTSSGPAFYRAKRAGLGGRAFCMFKLRTMFVGTDTPDRRITADNDERVTPVGKPLRRFHLDELPQLWNVLRGDMSVVGPRPEDWDIVQNCYTPEQRQVLGVAPGVVSPADVRWYPTLTYHDPPGPGVPLQQHYLQRHLPMKLVEETLYVKHHNMLVDLKVIGRTIACILIRSWLPPKRDLPLGLQSSDKREAKTDALLRRKCPRYSSNDLRAI
jgi:lipopolysaccharide/colanic/teichoic acid biosynthesis glycosyltransferase